MYGTTLASGGGYDNTVRLWDVATGQLTATLEGHAYEVNSVAFSPDGGILASGSSDQTIRLWDVATGQLIAILKEYTSWGNYHVWSVSFSPSGETLVSGNSDTIRLWDVATGQLITTIEQYSWGSYPYSMVFSPDGTTLAGGDSDGTIRLWDVTTGQLMTTIEQHSWDSYLYSMVFSPDGTTLAGGGNDGTIQLWDVTTGQLITTFRGHIHWISSVAFSPDRGTLASAGRDGTILLWDMSPYITPSTPTAVELSPTLPTHTSLLANYPNPFNPNTYIPYQLHAPAHVRLTIYDIRGALIREIDLGYQQAGQYLTSTSTAQWDGRDQRGQRVASGVYLYQLQAGPVVHGRKMVLVK